MIGREGVTGLVCLAASLGLLAATWGLPGPTLLVPVGPGFYPRIVLGITVALSAILVAADFASRRRQPSPPEGVPANYALVLSAFAIFGFYVGALPWFGFRVSTFVFVAALYALLDPPQDWKRWLLAILFALIVTAVTYYLFDQHLLVLLPRGRWTDF